MSVMNEQKFVFIQRLKKLASELAKFKNDSCIDDIKMLFIRHAALLNETPALNNLINQLIVLAEKSINPQEVEEFLGLLSTYWLECLLASGFYVVFFGEHDGYARLRETLGANVAGSQHVLVNKETDLEAVSVTLPDDRYIVAVYDDNGTEFLKVKARFRLHEIIFVSELYRVWRRRAVKDDIASLLDKHRLLRNKHHVLLSVNELLLARELCFGL